MCVKVSLAHIFQTRKLKSTIVSHVFIYSEGPNTIQHGPCSKSTI